jgi:hypothetical protein
MIKPPPMIDIEASGFGRGSYPIEVAFALEDGITQCFLIKPDDSWTHWAQSAEDIHGITREQLQADGLSVREVAERLNKDLIGKTLYTDAWSFDSSWLGRLFDCASIVQRFRLETINKLLTEDEQNGWADSKALAVKALALELHRADNDVKILQHTFTHAKSTRQ